MGGLDLILSVVACGERKLLPLEVERGEGIYINDTAHAAEPLRQRAPELDAARQRGRRAEDGGARRREAGNGLKQRVHIAAASSSVSRKTSSKSGFNSSS